MWVVAPSIGKLAHVDLLLLLALWDVESTLSGRNVQVLQEILDGEIFFFLEKSGLILGWLLLFLFVLIDELKLILQTREILISGELIRDVLPDHSFEQVKPDVAILTDSLIQPSRTPFQCLIRHTMRSFVTTAHQHNHPHEALSHLLQSIQLPQMFLGVKQKLLIFLDLLPVPLQQSLNDGTHNNTPN